MGSFTVLLTWASGPTDLKTADQNKATLSRNPAIRIKEPSRYSLGKSDVKVFTCMANIIPTKTFLYNAKPFLEVTFLFSMHLLKVLMIHMF